MRSIDLTKGRELGSVIEDITNDLERQRRLSRSALLLSLAANVLALASLFWVWRVWP